MTYHAGASMRATISTPSAETQRLLRAVTA